MNLIALLMGAYLAFSSQKDGPVIESDRSLWQSYKQEHGKVYESESIDSMRRAVFAHNKRIIDEFNAVPERPFSLALNHMADWADLEYSAINGFQLPEDEQSRREALRNSPEGEKFLQSILEDNSTEVPDEVDWRKEEGRVSPVKNQGQCGSCWAFASTGVLEGQEKLRPRNFTGNLLELSEQNLVDCVKADAGCNGGFMKDALDYVKVEGGIEDEHSYPYEARTSKCRFMKAKSVFTDAGGVVLPVGDEQKLKEVVAKFGPVAVAIDASSLWFQFYRHGVYYNRRCRNKEDQLDHGVLVVGYGTDPKQGDYWIVKNSWGPKWGDHGYIKMARNRKNNCGIATAATIPTF